MPEQALRCIPLVIGRAVKEYTFHGMFAIPPHAIRYLTASGDHMFKQRKRRFFALIQLDQYQFLLSTFPDNASLPKENLLLDQSFFVEYPSDEG